MREWTPELSISIVSHAQAALVQRLLLDIEKYCVGSSLEVILTLNVAESLPFDPAEFGFPLLVIHNQHVQGFGQNHNRAFAKAKGRYFCVLNPDIRLLNDPFVGLIEVCTEPRIGVVAPRIEDERGNREDSARHFPTFSELIGKLFGGHSAVHDEQGASANAPDWVAGMFLVFPREIFARVGGFDEHYFLYYEDVDLCLRLRLSGLQVRLCGGVSAIHEARHTSHRNPKYLYWHVSSMMRFFFSRPYRKMRQSLKV